jgi:signal transduction histidine kinase
MIAPAEMPAGDLARSVVELRKALHAAEARGDAALAREAALAEVLAVINRSPGDPGPVFQTILQKAHRLCGVSIGSLGTYDGRYIHVIAAHGYPPDSTVRPGLKFQPTAGNSERLIAGERLIHYADVTALPAEAVSNFADVAERLGVRTVLLIPLRKDGVYVGGFSAMRTEVQPFTEAEISLLESFAAQAVIAMENARLLTEQREALERQTATAEVLQVINANPGNLAPIFDAILEKAHHLCDAEHGSLYIADGAAIRAVAVRGMPDEFSDLIRRPFPPGPNHPFQQLSTGAAFAAVHDAEEVDDPIIRRSLELAGMRSALFVPLRQDRLLLGCIVVSSPERLIFTDKQVALLQNFAAQAVIAMENARLLNEQREALEQQTATAEVLQVINASAGDLKPVFQAILDKAHILCGAEYGVLLVYDGELFWPAAVHGHRLADAESLRRGIRPGFGFKRLLAGERLLHIHDMAELAAAMPEDPVPRALHEISAVRTQLAVPLRLDGRLLGVITANRREVRPFSEREITLIESFATQAVIAMENARLLNEVRQRQEELRVTFENMGDGVAMFDAAQCLVAWNGKFQEVFDLPDALLGQHCSYAEYLRFLAVRGDFGAGVDTAEHIERLVASTGQPYGYERTRPDGRVIEIRRNPVPDGGFVLIFSDITERKRSETEIRVARDTAEAAYRDLKAAQASLIQAEKMASLGQLTAGIAHEIKNPLNFVNNFAALSVDLLSELKETAAPGFAALSEQQRAEIDGVAAMLTSNLEKISEHGKRADGIVKAMLEHSRGSSGERRAVDLNALIDEALNLAYHGARAQDPSFNLTLERDFAESMAPIEVNPQDMTRVLLNLFSNGFYAVTRRVREGVNAGFVPTLKITTRTAGDAVEILVWDNGTGIPDQIMDKLFQPFFTTKPTGEGTGLGLSITYDIVTQQHGGSIAVTSRAGEYTEFTLRLPRRQQATPSTA